MGKGRACRCRACGPTGWMAMPPPQSRTPSTCPPCTSSPVGLHPPPSCPSPPHPYFTPIASSPNPPIPPPHLHSHPHPTLPLIPTHSPTLTPTLTLTLPHTLIPKPLSHPPSSSPFAITLQPSQHQGCIQRASICRDKLDPYLDHCLLS